MAGTDKEFDPLTHAIIAAAFEVHQNLGPGFQELIYQRALYLEMKARDMEFVREAEIPVFYRGRKIGARRVDFLVQDCLVEIKAKACLEDVDFVQTLSYLRSSGKRVALLLNFGSKKMEIKRIVN